MAYTQAIVLKTPQSSIEANALSTLFGQELKDHNPLMSTLDKLEKEKHKQGIHYTYIETKDWQDFEIKLNRQIQAGNFSNLLFEQNNVVTSAHHALLTQEHMNDTFKSLQKDGKGDAQYADSTLTIGFMRIALHPTQEITVEIPYVKPGQDRYQSVIIHSPDMKNPEDYKDKFDFLNAG